MCHLVFFVADQWHCRTSWHKVYSYRPLQCCHGWFAFVRRTVGFCFCWLSFHFFCKEKWTPSSVCFPWCRQIHWLFLCARLKAKKGEKKQMASRPESLEPGTPLSGALPFSGRANTRLESNEQRETVQSAGRKCAMSGPRHAIIEYTLDVPNGHNNTCPFTNGSIDCSGFRRKRSRKTEMSILTNFFVPSRHWGSSYEPNQ